MSNFGSKKWDFDSTFSRTFSDNGVFSKAQTFFQKCLGDSIDSNYIEYIISFFISMFVLTLIIYSIYFAVIKPKLSADMLKKSTSLTETIILEPLFNDPNAAPYLQNLPYPIILNVSKQPDPNYVDYNKSVITTFNTIYFYIITVLLLCVFVSNNLLCSEYSLLRIFGENIITYIIVSIFCAIFFMYYTQRYQFISAFDTENIFIDRLVQNTAI